ncbi:MAG: hypothetical protein ACOX60_05425 [Massiliimalia sp.]|jgi:hypothetical protein
MTGWIIFGSIVLVVALILSLSGVVYVHFSDEGLTLKVGAFGLGIVLMAPGKQPIGRKKKKSPRKKKKKASKTKQKVSDAAQKAAEKHPRAKEDMSEFISALLLFVRTVFQPGLYLLRHLRFTSVFVWMRVGKEDADETALSYAKTYSAVSGILAVLSSYCTVKIKQVDISADFVRGTTSQDISFKIKLRLGVIVWALLCMIGNFLVITIKKQDSQSSDSFDTKTEVSKHEKEKEGNHHE